MERSSEALNIGQYEKMNNLQRPLKPAQCYGVLSRALPPPSFVIFPTSLASSSRLNPLRFLNANVNRHDILHSRFRASQLVDEIFINNACECLD
jgi:hypothetical protein